MPDPTPLDKLTKLQQRIRRRESQGRGVPPALWDERHRLLLAALDDRYRQAEIARALKLTSARVAQLVKRARAKAA
jgi:hypothetical protein